MSDGIALTSYRGDRATDLLVRGEKVIVDADLARLYGVRPDDSMSRSGATRSDSFRLHVPADPGREGRGDRNLRPPREVAVRQELALCLLLNMGRSWLRACSTQRGRYQMSVFVIRAFVRLRHSMAQHRDLAEKLTELEHRLGDHDRQIVALVQAIRHLASPEPLPPRRQIGFRLRP